MLPLILILGIAIWLRLPLLAGTGYSTTDIVTFEDWTRTAVQKGLFSVYGDIQTGAVVDHPPLGVALLTVSTKLYEMSGGDLNGDTPGFRTAIKLPLFIFDLLLIAAGYVMAYRMSGDLTQRSPLQTEVNPVKRVFWASVVAAGLALTPGLIADSVWWGQTDGVFSFFMMLTVYALHRRKTGLAAAFYALTILTKFQGIALLPIIVVLTFRRFGLMGILRGVVVFAIVFAVGIGPFVMASGESAWRPYRESVGKYPFISINAHNFWYWSLASRFDLRDFGQPNDDALTWGPGLTTRTVGFVLFAIAAGLIALRALAFPERKDEFLLAAGLHVTFFMFSTQMHERYLYPAVVLMALAMVGSRWLWMLWLGFAVTVSQNILDAGSRNYPLWEATWQVIGWANFQNARLNVILTVILMGAILAPFYLAARLPVPRPRTRLVGLTVIVVILLLAEAGLRVGYSQLPAWMQQTIQNVRITPLTEWRIATTPLGQPDPEYGAVVRPGMAGEFALPDATIKIATASLMGTRVGIRDGVIRLPLDAVAIGGTDTFCLTNAEDCWVNLVASERALSIANLGQPETGSAAHLAMLRNFGRELKPRFVLWQWSVYDLRADYRLALVQGRTGKLEPPLVESPDERPAVCHPSLGDYSALYALICAIDRWPPLQSTARVQYGGGSVNIQLSTDLAPLDADRPDIRFGYDQTVLALEAAHRVARDEMNATLIILVMPTKEEIYSDRASPPLDIEALRKLSESRARLLRLCSERGWRCLDLYPALRARAERAEQIFYPTMPNLNPAGNRAVAQAIGEFLAGLSR